MTDRTEEKNVKEEARYWRKKPIPVKAVQLDDAMLDGPDARHFATSAIAYDPRKRCAFIQTLHGTMRADVGDWIVQGPTPGDYWPVRSDIFAATYEPADAPAPEPAREQFGDATCQATRTVKCNSLANHVGEPHHGLSDVRNFYVYDCATEIVRAMTGREVADIEKAATIIQRALDEAVRRESSDHPRETAREKAHAALDALIEAARDVVRSLESRNAAYRHGDVVVGDNLTHQVFGSITRLAAAVDRAAEFPTQEPDVKEPQTALDFIAAFRDFAPRAAQLLDGWHNDGTAWSEWDETVRQELSALQQRAEALAAVDRAAEEGRAK